jgi:hypothetical protein
MASIVPGMTMSQVRRCLQQVRTSWGDATPWEPFDGGAESEVNPEISIGRFALHFVAGHHTHRRRPKRPRPDECDDCDDYDESVPGRCPDNQM